MSGEKGALVAGSVNGGAREVSGCATPAMAGYSWASRGGRDGPRVATCLGFYEGDFFSALEDTVGGGRVFGGARLRSVVRATGRNTRLARKRLPRVLYRRRGRGGRDRRVGTWADAAFSVQRTGREQQRPSIVFG